MNFNKIIKILFAIIIFLAAIAFSIFLFSTGKLTSDQREMAFFVLGFMFGMAKTVVDYYYGSSEGSSNKNDIIAKQLEQEKDKDEDGMDKDTRFS